MIAFERINFCSDERSAIHHKKKKMSQNMSVNINSGREAVTKTKKTN